MSALDYVYAAFLFLAGVGVFLYGMNLMGDSLELLAGKNLKKMFSKTDNNIFAGLGIGIATTTVIQSSSAVTVMAVGFVNAGFMSLLQATGIIFGANIGTTVTAQLMALGLGGVSSVNLSIVFASLAGIGAFMLFSKKDMVQKVGKVLVGFGILFVGLIVMGDSTKTFAKSEAIIKFMAIVKNPILLLLVGVGVTAIIQSSSAFSGIILAMTASGMITFDQGLYMIIGSNIGTCVTALIASIGTCTNAKRVALIHVMFNVLGSVVFMLTDLFAHYGDLLSKVFPSPQTRIAMAHTLFNVGTVIILLPFAKLLVKLSQKIIRDKDVAFDDFGKRFYFLDYNLLKTPSLAVSQASREVSHMLRLSIQNYRLAMEALISGDTSVKEAFYRTEDIINYLNIEITKFLSKLSSFEITENDHTFISASYHILSDIERIGDHAVNILEFALEAEKAEIAFSDEGKEEMEEMLKEITIMYELCSQIYDSRNLSSANLVFEHEEIVDALKDTMGANHIKRLSEGSCTPEAGAIYLNLASNCERVGDHLKNIVVLVGQYSLSKAKAKALRQKAS